MLSTFDVFNSILDAAACGCKSKQINYKLHDLREYKHLSVSTVAKVQLNL